MSLRNKNADSDHVPIVCLEGNGSRDSHKGDGYNVSETMFTLNTVEHHAVCYRKQGHPQNSEQGQGWQQTDVNDTLNVFDNGESRTPTVIVENHPNDSRVKISEDGVVQTLSSRMGTGGGNVPMVMEAKAVESHAQDARYKVGDVNQPVSANMEHDPSNGGLVIEPTVASKASFFMKTHADGKAETLVATDYKDPQLVAYGLDRASYNQGMNAQYDFSVEEEKIGTQVAKGPGAVLPCGNSIVRRLTPLECERLQGFPDGWTDIGEWFDSKGKKHKDADSPRYKALGNSIALPFWEWMAKRMCKYLDDPTMASLFDGISGFPLVFSRAGCMPIWSSEIEEFPIAVAKKHFPDD